MTDNYAITESFLVRSEFPPGLSGSDYSGFRYKEVEKSYSFSLGNSDYNHLFFLLEGEVVVSCNEFSKKTIHEHEFVLIPIAADVLCKTTTYCRIMILSFDYLPVFGSQYHKSLIQTCSTLTYQFVALAIDEPLKNFIDLLLIYFKEGLNKPLLHEIKTQELFVILQSFYTKKQIAMFFHPIIGHSSEFRTTVYRNYRKVTSLEELASLFNIEKRTFTRQFKEEFGKSPYQWLLNQKAKHVHFSLVDTKNSLDNIRKEHGFKFAAHFTRFCWEQFSCSPVKLRKQLLSE